MIVLAARQVRLSTAIATRSWPKVSPPLTVDTFDPAWLGSQAIIFVCAHGLPGHDVLYGDDSIPMLSAAQIRSVRMDGAIVYLAGCYGQGPISDAFLAAGAACVVADADVNWSGPLWPSGSNKLGQLFLGYLYRALPAGAALAAAKRDYGARYRGPRDFELLETVSLIGDPNARLRTDLR